MLEFIIGFGKKKIDVVKLYYNAYIYCNGIKGNMIDLFKKIYLQKYKRHSLVPGLDLSENVRAGCRDARMQRIKRLVSIGTAERSYGKISLSCDMPMSRYKHTR